MTERCFAMDVDGRRCRKRATGNVRYHGDPELVSQSGRPGWVVAPMCEPHFRTFLPLNRTAFRRDDPQP
jgi:hypothetical protein